MWATDFPRGCQNYAAGKGQRHQTVALGKLDLHTQKNEAGP